MRGGGLWSMMHLITVPKNKYLDRWKPLRYLGVMYVVSVEEYTYLFSVQKKFQMRKHMHDSVFKIYII